MYDRGDEEQEIVLRLSDVDDGVRVELGGVGRYLASSSSRTRTMSF